ncbi:MAC/Perforin domain protein, partial [Bacteroides xylanisolvens]
YKDIGDNLIPLYEYYNDDLINHYTSTDPTVSQIYDGWHFLPKSISGYVYPAN